MRADYLVEQAGYTFGVAAFDGRALEELLPDGFVAEVKAVLEKVNEARKDKALMAAESKSRALGAINGLRIIGFEDPFDLGNDPDLRYGEERSDHSKEFLSNVIEQWKFYSEVMNDLGFRN